MTNPAQVPGAIPAQAVGSNQPPAPRTGARNPENGSTSPTFIGHPVSLPQDNVPPGGSHNHLDGLHAPGQVPGHGWTDNVSSVNPTVTTKGSPELPETEDSKKVDEDFKNLNDQELLKRGDKQLEEAKKAYTTYGQNSLAHNARKALEPFIECANNAKAHFPIAGVDWFKSSEKLIESLKKLELPQGTPDDFAVTIQFPGEEVISLIPPGNGLKTKNPTQVYECYVHAFGVMDKKVTEFNNGNDNALAQAEARFNDVFATLRAIREEIDKRKLKQPSGSQLEYDFQKFRDNGITINAVADGREFAFYENKFLHKAPEAPSKPEETAAPDSTAKPEETTAPASTDGETETSSPSPASVEENPKTPESSPGVPKS
ncbi:hypothetical protein [Endozoicomonas atrinae]|uniref:hypothetical protein n=1 Tax=Endozoicomonas atrinae TaxID=1333660 RepID=UPI003AFFFD01